MRKHPTMKLPKDSSNPSVNAQISAQILFDQLKAMQHVRAQETQKAENHSAQKKARNASLEYEKQPHHTQPHDKSRGKEREYEAKSSPLPLNTQTFFAKPAKRHAGAEFLAKLNLQAENISAFRKK